MKKIIIISLVFLAVAALYIYLIDRTSVQCALPRLNHYVQRAGNSKMYPDPALTPGDVIACVTAEMVCVPGYSSSVRKVPKKIKKKVFESYGYPYPPAEEFEVDHHISLELGGSNDIKNLWPEKANPHPGFHEKDVVENYLHHEVCSGRISLTEAQEQIGNDWYAVYLRISESSKKHYNNKRKSRS